jgi:hypothetical protein|nr:PilZ domain-containing protein [Kofleriaceae bacterium]
MSDHRRAGRILVNAPAIVESIGQVTMSLHPNLAAVYRRVEADMSTIGKKFPAVVRDLSTNGAFISGAPLPLMSRVALRFEVRGIGAIDAVGWVLWQRTDDCELPGPDNSRTLPKGFGVLFESIPLETRSAIATLVK